MTRSGCLRRPVRAYLLQCEAQVLESDKVEARLLAIETEAGEPPPVVVKRIAAVRVAELTGAAAG